MPSNKRDKEHVFPKNLYPESKAKSKIQRLTLPACRKCNDSWANDEAHFRNILVVAGDPITPEKKELWDTTVDRSFSQIDGFKRIEDLLQQMKPIAVDGQNRHMVFPGNDERVIRVIKKIIRGLCYHHDILSPLPEEMIRADILKFEIPESLLNGMEIQHRDKEIVEYRFHVFNEIELQSVWLITFFQTVTFIAFVSMNNGAVLNTNAG